jgi:hypothetical protein
MNKMRSLGDEMDTAGRKHEDDELVEYILTGIGPEYDLITSTVIARESPVSISELYAQLLAFEIRLMLMNAQEGGGSSANPVYHGHSHSNRGGFGRNGGGRDGSTRGSHGGYSRGSGRGEQEVINVLFVKFVRKEAIWPIDVGISLKRIIFPMREQLLQHLDLKVMPTGTRIQAQHITLQVI